MELYLRLSVSDDLPAGYSNKNVSGSDASFRRSNGLVLPLEEHLAVDPFIVRYADGTYSYN
jgi:hypothetical protein